MKIIFEAHATSLHNEAGLSSGGHDLDDVELSPLGVQQSAELHERYKRHLPDAVFTSDLQRSYRTAVIAFERSFVPIFPDRRLRECDYGTLRQVPVAHIKDNQHLHLDDPWPGGESYRNASARIKAFLDDVRKFFMYRPNARVLIIGHRATQYALEEHLNGVSLEVAISNPHAWTWQPGWEYTL